MKTENQINELFKTYCQNKLNSDQTNDLYLTLISKDPVNLAYFDQLTISYWNDLTSHLPYFFSYDDRLAISLLAAEKFAQTIKNDFKLVSDKNSKDENSKDENSKDEKIEFHIEKAWKKVLLDFNQNNYWSFQQKTNKAELEKTDEQKIFWKLIKYGWAFFQSMIILKIAVYYFGLESAEHPEQTSVIWVWVFFIISVSSLVFFAYRNRHDKG